MLDIVLGFKSSEAQNDDQGFIKTTRNLKVSLNGMQHNLPLFLIA